MMGHHLVMVFSSCLRIENKHLVYIKSKLRQIVDFYRGCERDVRVVNPDINRVEQFSWEITVDVL